MARKKKDNEKKQLTPEAANAYIAGEAAGDVGVDLFNRGLCLPSDNKMTPAQQDVVIETVRRCFR